MDLNISNKQIGEVSVIALKGRIVLGEGSSSLRERIKSLVGDGKKKIVVNMANVTYIDSLVGQGRWWRPASVPRKKARCSSCPI